jgi:hypothetical protein
MNHPKHFRILHISKQATLIIPKNRRKKATKKNILAIFSQRSVHFDLKLLYSSVSI